MVIGYFISFHVVDLRMSSACIAIGNQFLAGDVTVSPNVCGSGQLLSLASVSSSLFNIYSISNVGGISHKRNV